MADSNYLPLEVPYKAHTQIRWPLLVSEWDLILTKEWSEMSSLRTLDLLKYSRKSEATWISIHLSPRNGPESAGKCPTLLLLPTVFQC